MNILKPSIELAIFKTIFHSVNNFLQHIFRIIDVYTYTFTIFQITFMNTSIHISHKIQFFLLLPTIYILFNRVQPV